MGEGKIKVLYIGGWGRSGSTIIEKILGQLNGFFAGGELYSIWDRGLTENRLCGCGVPFRECGVWETILNIAFGNVDQIDPQEMLHLRNSGVYPRHLPLMLAPGGKSLLASRLGTYLHNLEKLYRAIQFHTGSKVIIDSSKYPSYGYVLGMLPTIDLHVVHLVRDARAVTFSWRRRKLSQPDRGNPIYIAQFGSVASSLRWNIFNLATEIFWKRLSERYLMLRYEDFVDKPQETIRRICDLIGEKEDSPLPFVGERAVELGINHTVSGNPTRFQSGVVEVKIDEEWMRNMRLRDRILVTSLTWPLLAKYKYSVRARITNLTK